MKLQEFSDTFDVLVDSYGGNSSNNTFNEYEKSVFLTQAQEQLVRSYYGGGTDAFELSESARRYLDQLVKTKLYENPDSVDNIPLSEHSKFYKLPTNLYYITYEQIKYADEELGCYNGSVAKVVPITQDEYSRVRDNPFRGPTKYRAIRLDCGQNVVEIISKYNAGEYLIRYIEKPEPIILIDLPDGLEISGKSVHNECKLNDNLHYTILTLAVTLAQASRAASGTNNV